MYQVFCDLCGQKKAKNEIRGIDSADGEYLHLTSDKIYSRKMTECDYHICTECLGKLGWKSEPEKDETGDNQ